MHHSLLKCCITEHTQAQPLWLPYILKAYLVLSSLEDDSHSAENMSTKSLKLRSPWPSSEKVCTIRSLKGFSYQWQSNMEQYVWNSTKQDKYDNVVNTKVRVYII